jgi:DNA replication and repair protein RecF
MFLRQVSLRQFRNFSRLDASFSPGLNLLVGPNGSGKSNILEAVTVLGTAQGHRGADLRHMIQWGQDGLRLIGQFEGEEPVEVDIRQKTGRARQIALNGRPQKRLRDWLGRVPVVSFSPDDLTLVKGEPSVRRRLLNNALCQTDPDYLERLQRFNKVVAERNAALRQVQDGMDRSVLEPWNASLLKDGAAVSLARQDFLNAFRLSVEEVHARLVGRRERVDLTYKPSLRLAPDAEATAEINRQRLKELAEAEIAVGATLVGPHRDDVEIALDGQAARDYASQGQQRTLVLAVKIAEQEFLSRRLGRRPLFILDDVFSELDPSRREHLVESLAEAAQCLVSLTSLSDWTEAGRMARTGRCHIFDVQNNGLKTHNDAHSKVSRS